MDEGSRLLICRGEIPNEGSNPPGRAEQGFNMYLLMKQGNHGNGYALGTKLKQIICFTEQICHLV